MERGVLSCINLMHTQASDMHPCFLVLGYLDLDIETAAHQLTRTWPIPRRQPRSGTPAVMKRLRHIPRTALEPAVIPSLRPSFAHIHRIRQLGGTY